MFVLDIGYDSFRPDALFPFSEPSGSVGGGAAIISNGSVIEQVVTAPRYCGEITYLAAEDACGEFFISLTAAVFLEQFQTRIVSGTGKTLPFTADDDVVIHIANDGDVNRDGTVDLFDILCVLDGFEGRFNRCTLVDVDVAPCFRERGDGEVNLGDIFVVLNAFEGNDPCPPGCGSPRCPPS